MVGEAGEAVARARALAVLRLRGFAVALVLVPTAVAVVLQADRAAGRLDGAGWDGVRWGVTGGALAVLVVAGAVGAVITLARPAVSPTVPVTESSAPDLYLMVRDLADRLQVPAPTAIELTPDCDSWLEERRPAREEKRGGNREENRAETVAGPRRPPVLVIGSPFLWWMRVAELRALLAPVVAGTAPAADPEISAARRFVRGLDAAAGIAAQGGHGVPRPVYAFLGWVTRLLLRGCAAHVAEMERGVAASASERAQAVDYGLRIVAQEQVGLAYAGWDRLLTRVALPAWRMGRWPSRLDAGVVAALTELSRRDRLADGFETRLGERPACDLLEDPGAVDEAVSLLAARIFHGGPARSGPGWQPVGWAGYPDEVVDRIWRGEATRLIRLLDELRPTGGSGGGRGDGEARAGHLRGERIRDERIGWGAPVEGRNGRLLLGGISSRRTAANGIDRALREETGGTTLARVIDRLATGGSEELATRIGELVAQDEAARMALAEQVGDTQVYPLLPPRTGRELLADHVMALVCCAAVDTAGAVAGLDWLDGPTLLFDGTRRTDLAGHVLGLVEHGDPGPLRGWLSARGVRPDKPIRLG